MRILPFLVSAAATAGLTFALNTPLPVGKSKTPRLGYFLSPQMGFWQNAEAKNKDFNQDLKMAGLKGKVEVYVDDRLVPHVYAEQDLDAYQVQGYLHAKFRLWQMEFQTHVAAGRLSEIVGADRIKTDQFFRRLGMKLGAERTKANVEKNSPEMAAAIEAYAKGVNAYIASLKPEELPFEYKLLDYQPETWTTLKTYLFQMFMSYDLTARGVTSDLQMTNARNHFGYADFDQLFTNEQEALDPIIPKGTVFAPPSIAVKAPAASDSVYLGKTTVKDSSALPPTPNKSNGSNNWAVSGSKTKSGRPILCSDPHLGLNLPSLWFEIQITTPSHSTYGASFPGSPAVIIGFNQDIAWGVTNAGRDVIDFFDMSFKDATLQEYQFNGQWQKASFVEETIKVKGGADVKDKIAMTQLGPVMYDKTYPSAQAPGKYLAVKWSSHEASNGLNTFYLLNHAKNFDDYRKAISYWTTTGQNFVFADKQGDIAIQQQAHFVARWNRQGDFVLPGSDSSFDWQGTIPFEENPFIKNPARGFVSSANQKPVDETYPYYLGTASSFPVYRGLIINRKLSAMSGITPQDMMALQTDNYNVMAEQARPALMKYLQPAALNANEQRMVKTMADWNLWNNPTEKGATVFKAVWDSLENAIWLDDFAASTKDMGWPDEITLVQILQRDSAYKFADNIQTPNKKETLSDALTTAIQKATVALLVLEKENKLEWAKAKATRVNHLLKIDALSRMNLPIGGGAHIINATTGNHGPSWRMVVHLTDEVEAYALYPGGQSGNPGSHYCDSFVDYWAAGKYYPVLFLNKTAVAAHPRIKWLMTFTKA
ncbi:MAG: penicillin acylase family protein [Sphingobacteriia bacterium]|nr:MAG: penicillin acylase family protein [Sphingobacteriia bacterium]